MLPEDIIDTNKEFSVNLEEIIADYSYKVKIIALSLKRNAPPYVELDDIMQEGYLSLIEAAKKFDPSFGVKFWTYADKIVTGAMRDFITSHAIIRDRSTNTIVYAEMTDPLILDTLPSDMGYCGAPSDISDTLATIISVKEAVANLSSLHKQMFVALFVYDKPVISIMKKHRLTHRKFKENYKDLLLSIKNSLEG